MTNQQKTAAVAATTPQPEASPAKPKPQLLTCDPELESRPVEYLVRNILAHGMLTLLYGLRDCNKSTFAQRLAVELSRKGIHILILSAEENWQETLLPKLRGLGADFDFLEVLTGTVRTEAEESFFELSDPGLEVLRQKIKEKKTKLIIFDPLFSVLPANLQADKAPNVRRLLFKLKSFTESERLAILGIAHLNKDANQDPRNRLSGSAAWTDAPRFVYLMMRDPDAPFSNRRYLVANKANLLKDEDKVATLWEVNSIPALRKDGSQLHDSDGNPLTAPALEFISLTVETFDSLTDPDRGKKKDKQQAHEGRQRQLAKLFLLGALAWGPQPVKDIKARAGAAGITEGTLTRAKEHLDIIALPPTKKNGKRWFWSLPPAAQDTN